MLSERASTYDGVGVTLTQQVGSAGFRGYERSVFLGHGSSRWDFASTEILRWGVKTRSGFSVESGEASGAGLGHPVVAGDRYWLVAHLGPLRIHEPVQVIAVVDEPDRKGFAYGTLEGHPVRGEEAFLVDRRTDGSVWLTIRSLTRPSTGLWGAAYPLALLAQRLYRRRYFRSLSERNS
ncbi:uncharacterized protein (UPF0548 family) [Kribbella antiqua]|uniref:Uncharacterized protein (UPF0548 family) n=1 Tax=Kribbella antiqua TaxID=2512217 RepID=A0A4R2IUS9_9ACTN|nr:uncharacterized protein (UPF0548 family) [Kribbella antiqua]